MDSLFPADEISVELPLSPAQQQRTAAQREAWNRRQKRHRHRNQRGSRPQAQGVTQAPQSVTPVDEGVTLFDAPVLPAESATTTAQGWSLELRLFLAALETSTDKTGHVSRAQILSEVSRLAKKEGLLLMDAARFLDGALERGAIPHFGKAEWVSIPREVLKVLLDPNFELKGNQP